MRPLIMLIALIGALAACAPMPTPLPAGLNPPTPTSAPFDPSVTPPIRVGLSSDAAAFFADLWRGKPAYALETVDPRLVDAAAYDAVIAFGDAPALALTDRVIIVTLTLDSARAPLDDPALADLVTRAFTEPDSAPALRAAFADAGYPDGLPLIVANRTAPNAPALLDAARRAGIDSRPGDAPAHLTLTGTIAAESAAVNGVSLVLAVVPIRVAVRDGIRIEWEAAPPRIIR